MEYSQKAQKAQRHQENPTGTDSQPRHEQLRNAIKELLTIEDRLRILIEQVTGRPTPPKEEAVKQVTDHPNLVRLLDEGAGTIQNNVRNCHELINELHQILLA